MARPPTVALSDAVEFEYAVDDEGVNSADSAAAPKSTGTQSHVAVVVATATAPHPSIETPPNLKFTVPARDVVAVMRFVVRYCGDPDANSRDTVVDAYPTEIVKFDVDDIAPFASVTVTDTVEEPATVGVPEIVPVEVLKLKPFTKVPVNAYVKEARPPEPRTAREKPLFAVPERPAVGVAIVTAVATVIVKSDVDVIAPFASVTLTDTVEEPATVGVPEIVPVEVLKLKPFTKVPVNAYVKDARPPEPGTAREKPLFAVPERPVVGVAIVRAVATVRVAADDVVEAVESETPLLIVFVTTTV